MITRTVSTVSLIIDRVDLITTDPRAALTLVPLSRSEGDKVGIEADAKAVGNVSAILSDVALMMSNA